MALKGCLALVKQQSSAVAFTDEATTATGNISYQITDEAKRIWSYDGLIIVKDGGVATTESYTINRLTGTITFNTATSRTITVTGEYVLLSTVAKAKSFALNGTRDVSDVTVFNTEFKSFEATLLSGSAELGLIYDVTSTFFTMLTDGTIKVIEYYPNSSGTPIRFYGLCTNNSINSPVEGIIEESVSFQITKQIA